MSIDIKKMVDRFLGWKLPKDFAPDCGISFDGRKDDQWNKNKTWPIGTNLLTADQAEAMFKYALDGAAIADNRDGEQRTCGGREYCGRFPFCGCGSEPLFPERDPSKPAEQQGLFRKFEVRRVDGSDQPGGKHDGCRYFVLDMNHDAHAPAALRAYADSCADTHPELAADLRAEFGSAASASAGLSDEETEALARHFGARSMMGFDVLSFARALQSRLLTEEWQPMETAPKDGTMLRLLVQFDDHATEDSTEPCATIGANTFDHSGLDEWKFAGWSWSHDCFTEGIGTPVGWLPMVNTHSAANAAGQAALQWDADVIENAKAARKMGETRLHGLSVPISWILDRRPACSAGGYQS